MSIGAGCFVIGTPYLWLTLFFLVPFILVLKISLSESILAQPPYGPLWETDAERPRRSQSERRQLFVSRRRLRSTKTRIFKAVKTAFFSTLMALLIGYPMAYGIARAKRRGATRC